MLPMTVQPHYRLGSLEEALLGAKSVELGVVPLKTPSQPRLDPRKNQNGTMAKDALLPEKFISAECVR